MSRIKNVKKNEIIVAPEGHNVLLRKEIAVLKNNIHFINKKTPPKKYFRPFFFVENVSMKIQKTEILKKISKFLIEKITIFEIFLLQNFIFLNFRVTFFHEKKWAKKCFLVKKKQKKLKIFFQNHFSP